MSVGAARGLWRARQVVEAGINVSMGSYLDILGGGYSPQERLVEEDESRQSLRVVVELVFAIPRHYAVAVEMGGLWSWV